MLRFWEKNCFWIGIVLLVFLVPVGAEGRFINLGGSLDFSYGEMKTEQDDQTYETSFFQQRYNLHNFGELYSPRIGTMLINGTFLQQETKTDGRGNQGFHFNDYSVNMNLLPYISPLSLYYQRMNRTNQLDPSGSQTALNVKDRTTTLGGNWSLSSPRIPRIGVSFNQSELESIDDPDRLPNTVNRTLNLDSTGQFRETTLTWRYQFNESDVARSGVANAETIRANTLDFSTQSRLAPALMMTTYTHIVDKSGEDSGAHHAFAQEQGFGSALSYTPSVKWDTHARINISNTSVGGIDGRDLKQQNAFWSGSYRPTEELDMVTSARYFIFDVSDVKTTSPFLDYSLNYRPFFGLSTGFGVSYGLTEIKGSGADVRTDYQRYRANIDYTRALELIRYSTNYGISQSVSNTAGNSNPSTSPATNQGGESKDIMHTIHLGLENTQIRIVHLAFGYTFNDIDRSNTGPDVQDTGDQLSHLIQLNADSSYFRRLLREEDSLMLQSTASWTKIEGFGAAGESILLDGRGNYYFFQGAMLSVGYSRQDYPGGFYTDTDIFYEEVTWNFFIGDTSFSLGALGRQERTDGDASLNREIIQTTASISYRIGKFVLSADGRWGIDRSETQNRDAQNPTPQSYDDEFEHQSFFVRASRSF